MNCPFDFDLGFNFILCWVFWSECKVLSRNLQGSLFWRNNKHVSFTKTCWKLITNFSITFLVATNTCNWKCLYWSWTSAIRQLVVKAMMWHGSQTSSHIVLRMHLQLYNLNSFLIFFNDAYYYCILKILKINFNKKKLDFLFNKISMIMTYSWKKLFSSNNK